MTKPELMKLLDQMVEEETVTRDGKGKEYTKGDEDQLANFKSYAKALGLSPKLIWAVYAGKHFDAIVSYCKDSKTYSGEDIRGRIMDLRVYLWLLRGMVEEEMGSAIVY